MSETDFKKFRLKRKAGYNDALLAPDLVSNEPRISSPSTNIQMLSAEEAQLIRDIAGNPAVVDVDTEGNHYLNPVHLRPEFEAILNRTRMNRDIPDNGPYYAEQSGNIRQSSSTIETLESICKTLFAQKQRLIAERNDLMEVVAEQRKEKVITAKAKKIQALATSMQAKGLLPKTREAYASKVRELAHIEDEAFIFLQNLVNEAPITQAKSDESRLVQASNQSLLGFDDSAFLMNNGQERLPSTGNTIGDKLKQLPWGSSRQ